MVKALQACVHLIAGFAIRLARYVDDYASADLLNKIGRFVTLAKERRCEDSAHRPRAC